ncbi:hypothetical protein [Methylacidiphilum kamchatkense]|uniref:hypothetical protein n=1 Tax=Methylacidiphilum kamchatkense TaxID=431057 RepID=UPI000A65E0A4|nr:hypothetical protein [Methylacidiphilum kamchatkense]
MAFWVRFFLLCSFSIVFFFGKLICLAAKEKVSARTCCQGPLPLGSWHKDIPTTTFWIGTDITKWSPKGIFRSSWDEHWIRNYGGEDSPEARAGLLPGTHAATLNPFYVALPFNDIAYPVTARKWMPWFDPSVPKGVSQCKGHWVEIKNKWGKEAYAQWMDVGPYVADDYCYVFGACRPKSKSGLDVSPAVKEYLGLNGYDKVSWRFVDEKEVPQGPWLKYLEEAILYSVIKKREMERKANESEQKKEKVKIRATVKNNPKGEKK